MPSYVITARAAQGSTFSDDPGPTSFLEVPDGELTFCLTGQYTPQALNAMRENPNIDRQAAVAQVVEAAGGKLVSMYGTGVKGPGVMVIFDVPDPDMSVAITGVAISAGSAQNVQLTRLFSMEEVSRIRHKRSHSAAPPGRPGKDNDKHLQRGLAKPTGTN